MYIYIYIHTHIHVLLANSLRASPCRGKQRTKLVKGGTPAIGLQSGLNPAMWGRRDTSHQVVVSFNGMSVKLIRHRLRPNMMLGGLIAGKNGIDGLIAGS